MHRNRHLFLIRVFSDQKNENVRKMQIWRERIDENAILIHFHAIRSSGEPENILPHIIDDVTSVWKYSKLSVKFLVSSVKVIDTVGFLWKFYPNNY